MNIVKNVALHYVLGLKNLNKKLNNMENKWEKTIESIINDYGCEVNDSKKQ